MNYFAYGFSALILSITLLFQMPHAFAQQNNKEDIFTVYGVKVDKTAEDAATARNSALATGQKQAFLLLSQRLLPDGVSLEDLNVEDSDISTLVKSFTINSEELSPVRYIATLTYHFRPQETENFFRSLGKRSLTAHSPDPVLVLPVMRYADLTTGSVFWSQKNTWFETWKNYDLRNSFVPVRIPLGDLTDMQIAAEQSVIQHKRFAIDALMQRHQTTDVLIAIFEMDDMSLKHGLLHLYAPKGKTMEHVLTVDVANTSTTQETLFQVAINRTTQFLQNRWKDNAKQHAAVQTTPQFQLPFLQPKYAEPKKASNATDPIMTDVVFQGMGQWIEIQKRMRNAFTIQSTDVLSLGRNEARVRINYRGSREQLRLSLQKEGLELASPTSVHDKIYELRISQHQPQRQVPAQPHQIVPQTQTPPTMSQ